MASPRRRAVAAFVAIIAVTTAAVIAFADRPQRSDVRVVASGAEPAGSATTATTAESPIHPVLASTSTTVTSQQAPPASTTSSVTRPAKPTSTPTSAAPTTTTTPATAPATTSTTAPAPECRNSHDAACGPFRWDPKPDNGPLTVKVTVVTPHPTEGEPVQLKIVLDDPDARIDTGCLTTQSFGDDSLSSSCHADYAPCQEPRRYGPWEPPAKRPDHHEMIITHTYGAGTFAATFGYYSMGLSCIVAFPEGGDPYGSRGTGTVTFTVAPATQSTPDR